MTWQEQADTDYGRKHAGTGRLMDGYDYDRQASPYQRLKYSRFPNRL